jgi:hypothetical protein
MAQSHQSKAAFYAHFANIGAGPRAAARRDATLQAFAYGLHRDNARTGRPEDLAALSPVIRRLMLGVLERGRAS